MLRRLDCEHFDPQRRRILQLGGVAALAPLLGEMAGALPAGARTPEAQRSSGVRPTAAEPAAALREPQVSRAGLSYRVPARDWESQALPIGNGRLGAMLFADPEVDRLQFNEQSLWGGVNNYDNALAGVDDNTFDTSVTGFGAYQNFGDLVVAFGERTSVTPGGPYTSAPARALTAASTATRTPSGASRVHLPR